MITLYDYELAADCYKIRLFLSLAGLTATIEPVEFYPAREQDSAWYRRISPLGRLPALLDGDLVLDDPQAILVHLGAGSAWYPLAQAGAVQQWLSFAGALAATAGAARLHDGMMLPLDIAAARGEAHRLLGALEKHLWFAEAAGQEWLCPGDHPTVADVACFPDIMLSEEGGISRIDYPAVRRWLDRFRRLPGFIVMPGIFEAAPAA